jgi:hypothetical protein
MRPLAWLLLLAAGAAHADDWRFGWDSMLYGYADALRLRDDSVLNPDNRIAGLSEHDATAEGRFDFKAERKDFRLTLRPILAARSNPNAGQPRYEGYLSQWQVRLRLDGAWSAAAGRELLNWGPAQFRSPSSPFYFDAGRGNPMRELSGIDTLKLSWTPDLQDAVTLAYVAGAGHGGHGLHDSWLLKADRRGDDWAGALILAQTPGQGLFLGAHGRYTYSDALLLYAEAGSSTRADALQSPADPSLPFVVDPRSARHATTLLGAAYTLDSGQTFNLEYLHDGHGYDAAGESAYFARAAASPASAGLALGHAPPLLGRDYLYLVWQSNLMETGPAWRLMATHGLTDHGNALSGYGEWPLGGHASLVGLASLPFGSARQESSSLFRWSLTLGVKVAVP